MKPLPILLLLTLLASGAFAQDRRKWKDTQGRTIDATYLAVEGESVKLKLSNGKTSVVPLDKLSEADRQWVKDRQAPPKPVVPVTPPPGPSADGKSEIAEIAKNTNWAPLTDLGDKLPRGITPPAPSDEQAIIAVRLPGNHFFIKADGSVAFPQHKFGGISPFSEDLAYVSIGELKGYINREGVFVLGGDSKTPLPEGSGWHGDFVEGRAFFRTKEGIGYIDKSGAVVIPVGKFKRGENFSEGLAAVSVDPRRVETDLFGAGAWQFINTAGEVVIPGPLTWPRAFSCGVARVKTDPADIPGKGPMVLIDRTGKPLLASAKAFDLGTVCGGYAICAGKVVDMKGNALMDAETADYRIGLIDSTTPIAFASYKKRPGGRMVHLPSKSVYGPVVDRNVLNFFEGYGSVTVGNGKNRWGCIDLTGHLVVPAEFSTPPEFKDGYAVVGRTVGEQEDAEQTVVINRKGKIIWQGEPRKKN